MKRLTPTEYLIWATEEKTRKDASPYYGSPIKLLFTSIEDEPSNNYEMWEFTSENWNGGDVLRHLLLAHWGKRTPLVDIRYYIYNDQKYIFLFRNNDFYEISWYKDRGRTEKIYMNGDPISLKDYITLYNYLYDHWEDNK